jgi:hypothetical protein
MDYAWGNALIKHQWDAIHAPGLVIGLFEKDEDAMMKVIDSNSPYDIIRIVENIRFAHFSAGENISVHEDNAKIYYAENVTLNDGNTYQRIEIRVEKAGASQVNSANLDKLYSIVKITDTDTNKKKWNSYLFTENSSKDIASIWKMDVDYLLTGFKEDRELCRINSLLHASYYHLRIDQKKAIINKFIAQTGLSQVTGIVWEEKSITIHPEDIVLDLIKYTKTEDLPALFVMLQSDNMMETLRKKIDNWGGADNYTKFVTALAMHYYKLYQDKLITSAQSKQNYLRFGWSTKFDTHRSVWYDWKRSNNKLTVSIGPGSIMERLLPIFNEGGDKRSYHTYSGIDPFDMVFVTFFSPPTFFSETIQENQEMIMPAFLFDWICNEYDNEKITQAIDLGVNVVSFCSYVSLAAKAAQGANYLRMAIRSIQAAYTLQSTTQLLGGQKIQKILKGVGRYGEILVENRDALDKIFNYTGPLIDLVQDGTIDKVSMLATSWQAIKNIQAIKETLGNNYQALDEIMITANKIIEEYGTGMVE